VRSDQGGRVILSPQFWDEFFSGSRRACARLITAVENEPGLIPEIRDRLIPRRQGAIRVGITGPPGVGKSTIASALAHSAVEDGRRVGVLAVDPSSPFTGGAFLGDRIRMQDLIGDPRLFIRSLASRDGHGGLSPATPHAADVFDAFGMDRIFIETVGVGQAELDVMTTADLIVLVLQPGTGDVIQTLKAGIIEAADLILINKSDLPGADVLLDSFRFLFDISTRPKDKPQPPVLTASALNNKGLVEAAAEIERLIGDFVRSGRHRDKIRARLEREIREAVAHGLWDKFSALTGAPEAIRAAADALVVDGKSPYPFIRQMAARIRMERADEKDGSDHGR
jgi:LAO/AO transport system kinase